MARTLLTTGEAAERAGVNRQTVHYWRLSGRLAVAEERRSPGTGRVTCYLYTRHDVDRASRG
jgi:DNA-binding transcriptional MerR regulator